MNEQEYNTLHHCCFKLTYHLVLVTKYRRRCITKEMLIRLKEIFSELCERWEGELLEFNGEKDHVRLLLELTPKIEPSKMVNNLKTVSSRLIRKEFSTQLSAVFPKPVFWSRSYCILSCGGAPLKIIKRYIECQDA